MIRRCRALRKTRWVVQVLFALVSLTSAQELIANQGEFNIEMNLQGNGDADIKICLDLSVADYTRIKGLFPNSFYFLQEFKPQRMTFDAVGETSHYDDASSAILISMRGKGLAQNEGNGRWYVDVDQTMSYVNHAVDDAGNTTFYYYWTGELVGGFTYRGQIQIKLPPDVRNCSWDPLNQRIHYSLKPPRVRGKGSLGITVHPKKFVMTCPYKVYGLGANLKQFLGQWVCRTSFINDGDGLLRNLKVRYQVKGYSDWSSEESYKELVPGQTIVSVYYPVMENKTARLKNRTPCDLVMQCEYEDSDGHIHKESKTSRITLHGVNEFVFSNLMAGENYGSWHEAHNNAPLLAAWTSRNDPVVKDFSALANKAAGGVGAGANDESAQKVLRCCYDLMRINDFTYQHPHGILDQSVSFDPKSVQNVLIPREVIRMRSGTCIDLAILYASMANALGLRPYLMLVPGHCFPVVELPSGKMVGIEVTGIGGGLRFGSSSYDEMLKAGTKEYYDALRDGRYYRVDLHALWSEGISNPELEEMPADILKRWEIRELGSEPAPRDPPSAPVVVPPAPPVIDSEPENSIPSLPFGPSPQGDLVDTLSLAAGNTPERIRGAVIKSAQRRGWSMVGHYQDQVWLKLVQRGVEANLQLVFNTQEVKFYSSSRDTRRDQPFVPTRWINYLKKDILAALQ